MKRVEARSRINARWWMNMAKTFTQRLSLRHVGLPAPNAAAVSPSARSLAVVTEDGLHLLELDTGAQRQLAAVHLGTARLIFSPDGRWLAVSSTGDGEGNDAGLWLWDLDAGSCRFRDPGPRRSWVAFSPDGGLLASEHASSRHPIHFAVREVPSGKIRRQLDEEPDEYWAASSGTARSGAFSPDNAWFAVAKEKFTGRWGHVDADFYSDAILLWEIASGREQRKMSFESEASGFIDSQVVEIIGFPSATSLLTRRRLSPRSRAFLVHRRVPELTLVASWRRRPPAAVRRWLEPLEPPPGAVIRRRRGVPIGVDLTITEAALAAAIATGDPSWRAWIGPDAWRAGLLIGRRREQWRVELRWLAEHLPPPAGAAMAALAEMPSRDAALNAFATPPLS